MLYFGIFFFQYIYLFTSLLNLKIKSEVWFPSEKLLLNNHEISMYLLRSVKDMQGKSSKEMPWCNVAIQKIDHKRSKKNTESKNTEAIPQTNPKLCHNCFFIQQENDPKHTKVGTKWIKNNGL